MRLLHFDHSDKLNSTDFRGKIVPPYAILSHRWGDSEVLFEDLGSENYKEKDGYRKLKFCARQAGQDKIRYFWVDTCCIDKWNLRERSRAINSMFRYYKNSTRCYVFLSDVSLAASSATSQNSDLEAAFRASEWFTRGWTLQELIAPASVEFFSCEGRKIGDKADLEQLILEITGIPIAALRNGPLNRFTTSERMKWAENRKTTEEEDRIYCLLGVLGVSLPTSYGEGREKAERRLQFELQAANSAPFIIPFSRNENFAGQESQLAQMEAELFGDNQAAILAIIGPEGIGKSELALEFAYRARLEIEDQMVFWLDASNIDSLYQANAAMAQKLNVPGWDDEGADVKQLVKFHLEQEGARRCLLIYDNVEDRHLTSNTLSTARAADVLDYLPQSKQCSIVITTANTDIPKQLAIETVVELGNMTPNAAKDMLENYLNASVSESDQGKVESLLQELSYHPLAVVQAAAYINTGAATLEDYRSQLTLHEQSAYNLKKVWSREDLQVHNTDDPVASTLFISLSQIRRDHALAADYLLFAACVNRNDIPLDLLVASSPADRDDALKVLSKYAIVTRRPGESAFNLHRSVHAIVRRWLECQNLLVQWTQHAFARLLAVFPRHDHSNRSRWRRLLPHAKYALSHGFAEEDTEQSSTLAWRCSLALISDGRYNESEELLLQLMERWKSALGDDHPETLTCIGNLAWTYLEQGRSQEAEELLVQVIESSNTVLGREHLFTLSSMANLASTYRNQGRWKEAEALFWQVVEIRERVLGEKHPDTLTSVANLASTYRLQGLWKEAEKLFVKVVESRTQELGEEHPDTLTSIANLASTYCGQGRLEEAVALQSKELEICSRVLGEAHPNTLTSMDNLATVYWNLGRFKEAEELYLHVVESRKSVLGNEHPYTLSGMNNLAAAYVKQGLFQEAEGLYQQVIETSKRVLGPEHPDTLMASGNLATTLMCQGRSTEAIALMELCVESRKQTLGAQHPYTVYLHRTVLEWRTNTVGTTF